MNQLMNFFFIVKNDIHDIFFNKSYNLCYGEFLKHFKNVDIVAVKTPYFIKKKLIMLI